MTQTTALIVNAALAFGLLGTLMLVLRLAHRLPRSSDRETLHPSQPLTLWQSCWRARRGRRARARRAAVRLE